MATKQELSKLLSKHLDDLGFSAERICERIHTMNKCSKAKDISTQRITGRNDIEKIFVGSQREGVGLHYLNDTDVLQIDHGVVCRQNYQHFENTGITVFKMERNNVPPGYCLLKLAKKDVKSESYKRIKYALNKETTGQYLSSKLYMSQNDDVYCNGTGYISENTHYMTRQGPSIPKYVNEDIIEKCVFSLTGLSRQEMDFVRAFPCKVEEMLTEWKERKRQSGWPSQETIDFVMNQPVHVVPVGQKGSLNEDLQWRICFNMAEIHLVKSFNTVQTKLFVLLKLIAKHILRPVSSSITSFVMKNVVLWLAEKTPQEEYCDEHVLDRLEDALMYLRECVNNTDLPYYMIPQRNLFTGKLQDGAKDLVLEKLDYLLHSGLDLALSYFTNSKKTYLHEDINNIIDVHLSANFLDKLTSCRIAMFSAEEVTEYFVTMFLYNSVFDIVSYNILFHAIPFLCTYGMQGLFEPLNIELIDQLTQDQKATTTCTTQLQKNLDLKQPRPPNSNFTPDEEILQTPVHFLFFSLFIDTAFFLNIPGLCSQHWFESFSFYVSLICCICLIIIQYKKTRQGQTFIEKDGQSIRVITYVPETLKYCENVVRSIVILIIKDFQVCYICNVPLRNTLWTLFTIAMGRTLLIVKELNLWQFEWSTDIRYKHCAKNCLRKLGCLFESAV